MDDIKNIEDITSFELTKKDILNKNKDYINPDLNEEDRAAIEDMISVMRKELTRNDNVLLTNEASQRAEFVSLTNGVTTDNSPDYYYNLMCRENSRSGNHVNVTVSWGIKVKGSSSSTYRLPLSGEFKVHHSYSGWFSMKGTESWNGTNDYRWFEKGFNIDVGGSGSGSFGVQFQQKRSDNASSTWNDTHYGTFWFTSSNTAPWWTSDDCRMNNIKGHAIIPENWGGVTITSATAWDNEQGGNLHYDIHRYVNDNYSAQIKWGGSSLDVADNIGGWGQGTKFSYECKVHDGVLWASGWRGSWAYTKNTFTRATVYNVGGIAHDSSTLSFWINSAINSGANNGHVNSSYGYRIESLTSGVRIHGTTELSGTGNNIGVILGVKNNGGNPTNPHWLDANELKNVLSGSNYAGNIRLRIVSWNSYGSSGNYDFDVWVDLRKVPGFVNGTYQGGTVNFSGQNYYMPGYKNIVVRWDHVPDPMGGNCTYALYSQENDGEWKWVVDCGGTNQKEVNMNNILGNRQVAKFRFILRATTKYGYYSDSGFPNIDTHWYNIPTITVTKSTRLKDKAVIEGQIVINTSIQGVQLYSTHWRDNPAGSGNNTDFTGTGSTHVKSFKIDVPVASNNTRFIHIASKDTLAEKILSNMPWGYTDHKIESFLPLIDLKKDLVTIGGVVDCKERLHVNKEIYAPQHENLYRVGTQNNIDEEFWFGLNGLGEYNNAGNDNVMLYHEWANSDHLPSNMTSTLPNATKKIVRIRSQAGYVTPDRGGFHFARQTYANSIWYFIFKAWIPVGYRLHHNHNAFGDGAKTEWMSPQEGTGKWETYICKATAGSTGNFSTIGYFSLIGPDATFEWFLASATSFDATRKNNLEIDNNGRHIHSNTLIVKKGCEERHDHSQIFFPAQANDPGRIVHCETDNTAQMWLCPGDDAYSTGGNDEVIFGACTGLTPAITGGYWTARHRFRMDGAYRSSSLNESSHGYQISSKKSEHTDMQKQDGESLYNYVKDLNIYNYRNIADIKENQWKARTRGDVMLGIVTDEAPLEIVNCDTESGNERNIELFSYITMTTGALKEAINKIESLESVIEKQAIKIEEMEGVINGIVNKE